jgi:hypothetical protein
MKYVFFAHFNRINMQRGDPRVWTVHFRGVCYQCRGFVCRMPIVTQYREEARQPRAILKGKAESVRELKSGYVEIK